MELTGSDRTIRVVLVEDHTTVRQAIAFVLDRTPGYEVVAELDSVAQAQLCPADFDVAIVDLSLKDENGTDVIKELRRINPQAMVMVLTASLDRSQLAQAVDAGASAVLHKSIPLEEITGAVRQLVAGDALMSMDEVIELLRLAGKEREKDHQKRRIIEQLSVREKQILQALANGLTDKEIAEQLRISIKTERRHMTSIFLKLGVDSRLQALLMAIRCGIVEVQ